MKTTPVTPADLAASVFAVPPLARKADFTLDKAANTALIRHIEAGGVTTLLYGGNANLYNVPLSEYAEFLDLLEEAAAPDTWMVPSFGPDYGRLIDQARILRSRAFPTVMALPVTGPQNPSGIELGLARAADAFGRPIIVYLKSDRYLPVAAVARLINGGHVASIKYAVERPDPKDDPYLVELLDHVDRTLIVSGMGERPTISHLKDFGLAGFTSGSVCIAPRTSQGLLLALKAGNYAQAEALLARLLPVEDLRDELGQIRVLHDAVTLAGIADMGPVLPMLANVEPEHHGKIAAAARELLAFDNRAVESAA